MNKAEIIHEVAHANVGRGRGQHAVKLMDATILERALWTSLGSSSGRASVKFFQQLHLALIHLRNALLWETSTEALKKQTVHDYEESISRLLEIAKAHGISYKEPPDVKI